MVSIRRHARDWIAYVARGGLGLARRLDSARQSQSDGSDSSDAASNHRDPIKPKPPSHRYRHYDYPREEEHRILEQFSWRHSYRLNIGIAVAAVLTVGLTFGSFMETKRQAVAAEKQLSEAQQQTRIAKTQAEIAERSTRPSIRPMVVGNRLDFTAGRWNPQSKEQIPPRFYATIYWTNFGASPAIVQSTEAQITIHFPGDSYPGQESYTALIIPAGKDYSSHQPYWRYTSNDELRGLAIGELGIYLKGRINYTDIAGTDYHTYFCFLYPTHAHDFRQGLQRAYGLEKQGCINDIK